MSNRFANKREVISIAIRHSRKDFFNRAESRRSTNDFLAHFLRDDNQAFLKAPAF
ncbi:hypothetical protein [Glaciecola punicea]|uniref:hypothetical protein n=1 Tax=Glaciecola punicea TaxID=56804 RepID=UPI0013050F5F|nr:hypothetical protein [Glaciecola punicea]